MSDADASRSRGGTPSLGSGSMSRVNSTSRLNPSYQGQGSSSNGSTSKSQKFNRYGTIQQRERTPEPDEDFDLGSQPTAWLVKVPRFLYDGWSKLTEEDLNLGTIRVYDPDHKGKQRIDLLLPSAPDAPIPLSEYDPATAGRNVKRIPRQYEVKLTSEGAETLGRNIYAFREKEEGGEGKNGNEDDDEDGMEGEDDDDDAEDDDDDLASTGTSAGGKKSSGTSGSRGFVRRKRAKISTAFAGKVTNEAVIKPLLSTTSDNRSRGASPALFSQSATDSKPSLGLSSTPSSSRSQAGSFTPEYREILRRRKLEASKPKRTVKMLEEDEEGANNMLMAGLGKGHMKNRVNSFIMGQPKTSGTGSTSSAAGGGGGGGTGPGGSEKYVRIPRLELLDVLFSCYERYTYWTLKALREETKQPEAYLREVLGSIADQHKRGPYVGQWSLKGEFVEQRRAQQEQQQLLQQQQVKNEAAGATVKREGQGEGAGEGEGEEEEDDEEMDQVM